MERATYSWWVGDELQDGPQSLIDALLLSADLHDAVAVVGRRHDDAHAVLLLELTTLLATRAADDQMLVPTQRPTNTALLWALVFFLGVPFHLFDVEQRERERERERE